MSHPHPQKDRSKLNTKLISAFSTLLVSLSLWDIHKVSQLGEDMAVVKQQMIYLSTGQTNLDSVMGTLDTKEQNLEHRLTVLENTTVRAK